jgi:para-aminobenzoate synthetase component 1
LALAAADPLPLLLGVLHALPTDSDMAVMRDGSRWVVGIDPDDVVTARGAVCFSVLDRLRPGWWAGFLSYDLGRAVERFSCRVPDDLGLPDLALARFDARLVLDGHHLGVHGDGPGRRVLQAAARRAREGAGHPPTSLDLGPWSSSLSREAFEAGVRAVVALIEEGECYQVNLTRRLSCDQPADPMALFAALARANPAPHAALVRLGGVSVVSASPERFLRRSGDRVETQPIKGTAADPDALRCSAKDRAENVMIVDLARNDLGRVCRYGSVEVPRLCGLEAHPGLFHLVSTVRGALRPGLGAGDLLRAMFPPAPSPGRPSRESSGPSKTSSPADEASTAGPWGGSTPARRPSTSTSPSTPSW